MPEPVIKKQFIAGARCPKCGAMDKVQRWLTGENVFLYCVSCEHKEELAEKPEQAPVEQESIITLK